MELFTVAKAYYVLGDLPNGKATLEGIGRDASKFGWSAKKEQLEKATDFLAKTDLITKQ